MNNKTKTLLLHGETSPYRLPLFKALSEETDLEVYECQHNTDRRKWSIDSGRYYFKRKLIMFWRIGLCAINPTLLFYLLLNRYSVYILGEDQRIFFSELITFLFAKLYGKTVIIWSGLMEINYHEKYKRIIDEYILRPIHKFIYRHSDAFVAYSEETKQYFVNRGVPDRKIFVGTQVLSINQLMENNQHLAGTNREDLLKDKKVILCVSYFDYRKGLDYLINAFKSLNRSDTVLIMAGAGREEEKLKMLASEKDDIYFPGYIEGKEKAYYYSMADIFVFPTLSDAWGLVVNEAMMFGLPVITTNEAGCSEELIDGNGFVVKAGDSMALKGSIEKLLDNENLRQEMGARSKEIIKGFTIDGAKKTFIDAINYCSKAT